MGAVRKTLFALEAATSAYCFVSGDVPAATVCAAAASYLLASEAFAAIQEVATRRVKALALRPTASPAVKTAATPAASL